MRISGHFHGRLWRCLAPALLALPALAFANADVEKNIANSKNWAMQAGDMYNQRYSKLKQINASKEKANAQHLNSSEVTIATPGCNRQEV